MKNAAITAPSATPSVIATASAIFNPLEDELWFSGKSSITAAPLEEVVAAASVEDGSVEDAWGTLIGVVRVTTPLRVLLWTVAGLLLAEEDVLIELLVRA